MRIKVIVLTGSEHKHFFDRELGSCLATPLLEPAEHRRVSFCQWDRLSLDKTSRVL